MTFLTLAMDTGSQAFVTYKCCVLKGFGFSQLARKAVTLGVYRSKEELMLHPCGEQAGVPGPSDN